MHIFHGDLLILNKAISWKDFTVVVPRKARLNHILVLINRVLLLLEIT